LNEVSARVAVVGPSAQTAWAAVEQETVPSVEHVIDPPRFDALLSESNGDDPPGREVVAVGEDDLAVLMFTSGTAGAPKAAKLTHGNLLANIHQVQHAMPLAASDVVFGVLPLFHIFGLNVVLGCAMASGATLVLVERFDPQSALETIRDRSITVMAGAPAMWAAMAQMPGVDRGSMSSLRLAVTGAAKMPDDVARAFEERCGVVLVEGYGLTEASPVVTTSVVRDDRLVSPIGSIGEVLQGVELRLVDDDGDDAEIGDPGEIWVRGPNVFAGYWHDDEATSRVMTPDGWLRTGDIAVSDDDGNLFIVDRVKDLIIVSGFNVFPAEVEAVLTDHPAVQQCAVVGVPHPHSGEAVKAFVVPQPGIAVEEDNIIEFAHRSLSRYKCPSKVQFVDTLPVNVTGKVLRRALR
jgi:long-chain acyl-CoA synthetase